MIRLWGYLRKYPDKSISIDARDPIYAPITFTGEKLNLADVKLLAPVIPRSKVVCVGKNYADHAAEMNSEVPKEPVLFIKPNTSVIGPDDAIVWPAMSERVDHEVELAIVIGKVVAGSKVSVIGIPDLPTIGFRHF